MPYTLPGVTMVPRGAGSKKQPDGHDGGFPCQKIWSHITKTVMVIHVVLWHGSLIGLYTCATDAAVASKPLHRSTVVTCHLNAESEHGAQLLASARVTMTNQIQCIHKCTHVCPD